MIGFAPSDWPFRSSTAPLEIVSVFVAAPNAEALFSFSVPRLTAMLKVVAPLAPLRVRVLVPCFVKVGVPVATAIVLSVRSP